MNLRLQLGFLALAAGSLAITVLIAGSGCTMLTNDALPDVGFFEAGDVSTPSCGTCTTGACVGAAALCAFDLECLEVRACATACNGTDLACATACACAPRVDGGALGGAKYRALATCGDRQVCGACSTDCASSCGDGGTSSALEGCGSPDAGVADAASDAGDAGAAPDAGSSDCTTCSMTQCGDATRACAAGSECAAFLACSLACSTAACTDECGRLHATGKSAAVELATCTQAGCEVECGLVR